MAFYAAVRMEPRPFGAIIALRWLSTDGLLIPPRALSVRASSSAARSRQSGEDL